MTYTCTEKEVDYLQADARDGKDASERACPAVSSQTKLLTRLLQIFAAVSKLTEWTCDVLSSSGISALKDAIVTLSPGRVCGGVNDIQIAR
jgi:hypothetical protein